MKHETTSHEERILILAPTEADRKLSRSILTEAGLACHVCNGLAELVEGTRLGAGAILLTEDVLVAENVSGLVECIHTQPPWSDIPICLLSSTGEDSVFAATSMELLGNVTVLERPVRLTTVVSALKAAIRARRRQYDLRDKLQSLEKSEERFRTLADNIAQFAWTADKLGWATWYNKRWYDYTGTTWEEMKDRGWERVVHPDHLERVNDKLAKCLEKGETWEDTFPLLGSDGHYRWYLSRSVPIRNATGEIERWLGTNTDITEQRAIQEALHESESRVKQLLSLMPMAVYTCDRQGRINFFNRQAAELWGREPEIGAEDEKFCGSFRLWTQDGATLPHCETPMAQAVKTGQSSRNVRVIIERPDGSRVTVSVNIDPLYDASGARLGAINVFEDVTERVQAEEAMKAADRRKDEFLAMLAHELRNPLAPIRTGLQFIQMCGDDRKEVSETVEVMDRQLRQLVRLIDDLLDISRITRGKIELRRERCELGTVLSMAIESCSSAFEDAGVELSVNIPEQPVSLDADPARLSQVFANLLTNGAKYTQRGGQVWLTAQVRGQDVVVSVRDNGIGIRKEALSDVFEMFTQVDTTERSHGGLGLGLSVVRALVALHDGDVQAHSDGSGQGSEFIVRLPVVVGSARRIEQHKPVASNHCGGRRRVLVVDDNQDAARTLSVMLRVMGNEVRTAHDGVGALEAAEAFRPELVLLDLGMPKLNGYDTAQRIRETDWGRHMTLVAVTGLGQAEDRRRSKEAGFDQHCVKPIDAEALRGILAEVPFQVKRPLLSATPK